METGRGVAAATKVTRLSNRSLSTLPTPTDAIVNLRQIKAHTAAFVTFSGKPPSEARVAKERLRIEKALVDAGYAPASSETLTYPLRRQEAARGDVAAGTSIARASVRKTPVQVRLPRSVRNP